MMKRLSIAILVTLSAATGVGVNAGQWTKGATVRPEPAAIDVRSFIGVNNLQMVVSNIGSFAFDPSGYFGKNDGLYFPRGTNKTVIFAAGLWIGAKVNGSPRVAIAEYSSEYVPGPMAGGTYQADRAGFRVYKVGRNDDSSNPDYVNWPVADGAPVVQAANGEDSLDENGYRVPNVFGDQMLYAVYNDANHAAHNNNAGSTQPLGIQVQQYVVGYERGGALGNSIYIAYQITNAGDNLLEDTYVSLWCDPDVGDASDDFVGCDTALSLGFAYNEGSDDVYGEAAPAVGFDFLQGPLVPSPGDTARYFTGSVPGFRNLPMTSFNNYGNGRDPQNSIETYNYMQGLEPSGEPVIDPISGDTTLFQLTGDPVTGDGWLDVNSGDRRYMMTSGPFTMAPGDKQSVVVAVLVGQGTSPLSSITSLKVIDEQVQSIYDLNFDIPFPPPQPEVWAQPHANRIDLTWDTRAEGDVQESEVLSQRFVMEGYNVYQGETPAGPWHKIATYDADNDITRIYNDEFDPTLGAVERILVQSGSNGGLRNHITITTDKLTGKELVNHRPYHFAVTAYSYDENNVEEYVVGTNVVGHLTEVLESRVNALTLVPNSTAISLADTALHSSGESDGSVTVQILEPANITGHEYAVTFNDDQTWNLDDLSASTRVLADQEASQGTYTDPIVDGMMVQVYGPPPGIRTVEWNGTSPQWVTGVNWGGYHYGGSVDEGCYFFGSSICDPLQLVNVELRFSPTETQKGYRYIRGAVPNYKYGGYGTVPFTAWDVSVTPARQLNVCFVEQFSLVSEDSYWLPPDDASDGGREYIFILNSDYSDVEDEYYTSRSINANAEEFDILYAWWPAVADGHSNSELAAGQVLSFIVNKYNTTADRFDFTTLKAGTEEAKEESALNGVFAVPNPYLHGTDLEPDQRNRLIKFAGLPPVDATVEIYNLVGERIRTLKKEQLQDSEIQWDVLTEGGLPPASGVYIYRVLSPGLEPKTGKLALFIDRERLRQF